MPYEHPDLVIAQLWRPSVAETESAIYAILDGARDEAIYPAVMGADAESCCLYRGDLAQDLAEAAPYLIKLEQNSDFTRWLVSEGWGQSWGIFLETPASLNELRRHFRRFLMVYDESGKPMYFRYYDPRVLRVYLPTCNETELRTIFGPVIRYCLENEDFNSFVEYGTRDSALTQRATPLTELHTLA